MKQHTVLVIAHRLSTIQDADRILCAPCRLVMLLVLCSEDVCAKLANVWDRNTAHS